VCRPWQFGFAYFGMAVCRIAPKRPMKWAKQDPAQTTSDVGSDMAHSRL
jgi:hypothetical protein